MDYGAGARERGTRQKKRDKRRGTPSFHRSCQ